MVRIPDLEIERLKTEVAIERVGRRPFHEDKTPSLVVPPKTNLWHCLGACHVDGSMIDWVMNTRVAAGGSSVFL